MLSFPGYYVAYKKTVFTLVRVPGNRAMQLLSERGLSRRSAESRGFPPVTLAHSKVLAHALCSTLLLGRS